MATLKDYIWKVDASSFSFESIATSKQPLIINDAEIHATVHYNLGSNAVFLSWYLPYSTNLLSTCKFALDNTIDFIRQAVNDVKVNTPDDFESRTSSNDLKFTGRIFIYSEEDLNEPIINELDKYGKRQGIIPVFRSSKYVDFMTQTQPPLAFISHSSLDKDQIARPIAEGLSSALCPVWYDEYSLKVGDRLRESIEKGIKDCKKCIVIITPNYLKNTGWVLNEFDAVFSKELFKQEKAILPVWSGVTPNDVYEYSPSLANRLALNLDTSDLQTIVNKLHAAIQKT